MFDRFKRSTDQPPREDRGAVATAERPDAAADRDAEPPLRDREAEGSVRRDPEAAPATGATTVADRGAEPTARERDLERPGLARNRDRDARERDLDRPGLARDRDRDATAVTDRDRTAVADRAAAPRTRPRRNGGTAAATTAALETARARQRDEFGGINWGASFFGWLVAVGVAAILTALLAAAGAAIGLTVTQSDVNSNAEEISLGGGIALLIVLMIAYYAGGYVAGRMSRFDGGRQGLGTWVIALVVTIALAVVAVIFGDKYNVLEQLNLPSIPVGSDTLATGGIIAIVAILLGTLIAAIAGGKVGERYHRRIDRVGFVD